MMVETLQVLGLAGLSGVGLWGLFQVAVALIGDLE
jgi:hypothetical protein